MKGEDPAICAVCGRTIDRGVAPDASRRCEPCGEFDSIRDDRHPTDPTLDRRLKSEREAAVERLRERYHEARALVASGEVDPEHRGQLDWILGVHDGDARGAAPLDARTSQLVVLWLEDLVRHLEGLAAWGADPTRPNSPASATHRAARGLHAATREFAHAFRRAADVECRP